VARAEARKLLAEFTLGKTSPQVISYKKAVEQFIEEKKKARRKSTANAYKGLLNRLPFEDQVTAITHEEVARKLRRITTQGAYNHHLVALKVFFNWLSSASTVPTTPLLDCRSLRVRKRSASFPMMN
jgi:hypothetical protein